MPGRTTPRTWLYNAAIYAPAKYKRACRYEAFVPDKLTGMALTLDATVAGLVSEAELAIRTLNETSGPALAPLARLLLRTEAIASSKIEGMQVGIRELARAEARAASGQDAGAMATELLANINAMVLAVDIAARAARFDVPQITGIHQRLLDRTGNQGIAGRIRSEQNWIGGNDYNPCGADFVPPPPEDVGALLGDLCEAINDDRLPPVVQAALVHAQFETIHPFADGNGRTGRALIHVVLRRRGVAPRYVPPISVALAAARTRYVESLTSFRGDDVERWIEHFAGASAGAAHLAKAYLNAVERLTAGWREKLEASPAAPRKDAAAWALIDHLPAHPVITAAIATTATGRAKVAIYDAIAQLTGAGVLVPLTTGQRNQSWEAVGLLELVAGLESGQLPANA